MSAGSLGLIPSLLSFPEEDIFWNLFLKISRENSEWLESSTYSWAKNYGLKHSSLWLVCLCYMPTYSPESGVLPWATPKTHWDTWWGWFPSPWEGDHEIEGRRETHHMSTKGTSTIPSCMGHWLIRWLHRWQLHVLAITIGLIFALIIFKRFIVAICPFQLLKCIIQLHLCPACADVIYQKTKYLVS